ncbi:unnamed protein product [Meganyctiphanes norvegica]|uniref:Cytochrome c oxidase subunit 5B, mitochondrial n=1 Tax=Meganyctiphanes norvegica TaxID=48144 RepID=A0AAV2QV72_MEGNR
MAAILARTLAQQARRGVQVSTARYSQKMMPDSVEHATGLEKQELLAIQAGNENPFDMRVYKRVAGGPDTPTVIPSFYERRLVGCVCEEDATCINFMWLDQGEKKRCECGYWFQLAEAKPMV